MANLENRILENLLKFETKFREFKTQCMSHMIFLWDSTGPKELQKDEEVLGMAKRKLIFT